MANHGQQIFGDRRINSVMMKDASEDNPERNANLKKCIIGSERQRKDVRIATMLRSIENNSSRKASS